MRILICEDAIAIERVGEIIDERQISIQVFGSGCLSPGTRLKQVKATIVKLESPIKATIYPDLSLRQLRKIDRESLPIREVSILAITPYDTNSIFVGRAKSYSPYYDLRSNTETENFSGGGYVYIKKLD